MIKSTIGAAVGRLQQELPIKEHRRSGREGEGAHKGDAL
jgi:hypothetical protein